MKVISFVFLFITCFGFFEAKGQVEQVEHIDPRIREVFRDDMRLLEKSPSRLISWTKLLEERISIEDWGVIEEGKLPKLSTVPLLNKYNNDLKRDEIFDLKNFNVLKYRLGFFTGKKSVYHIDGTNYVIIVQPEIIMK